MVIDPMAVEMENFRIYGHAPYSVVVVYGEYDSHPFEGVEEPLRRVAKNVKSILLPKCGHTPWIERFAKDDFYKLFQEEVAL